MARVPYVDPETLPEDYDVLSEEADRPHEIGDADRWNHAPTVQAFANNPGIAETHVETNVSLWTKSGLSPSEVETVILAVARAMDSGFEWHPHAIAAVENAGMSTGEVVAISRGDLEALDAGKRALVEYASEFVREYGAVSDATHDALAEHYDDGAIVGAATLAGFYVHLHHVVAALDLERDEAFVGWELENYRGD